MDHRAEISSQMFNRKAGKSLQFYRHRSGDYYVMARVSGYEAEKRGDAVWKLINLRDGNRFSDKPDSFGNVKEEFKKISFDDPHTQEIPEYEEI